ncbi:MAG TPA: GNAT family N-acetyltransferase [Candidatus Acidoferrum sp.]|nr:GNAT family N-acetyltransferase [Candidatus Acidoferrum sp.]
MNREDIRIRKAVAADVLVLRRLIEASVRELQAEDYTPAQMEGALESVFGVDSQLIEDGSYLVAEARIKAAPSDVDSFGEGTNPGSEWVIAGCGGWSKRKTLYGSDHWSGREDTLLDPKRDAAKIRAFFIDPAWARRGVGSKILEACEVAAREAGFTSYEMGATLTGAKLFGAKGYVVVENIEVPLKNGLTLPVIRMAKRA